MKNYVYFVNENGIAKRMRAKDIKKIWKSMQYNQKQDDIHSREVSPYPKKLNIILDY